MILGNDTLGELPLGSVQEEGASAPSDSTWAALTIPALTIQGVARVYPGAAASVADSVVFYYCKLTGTANALPDTMLPISSFQVRHRDSTDSYYNIVIPTYSVIDSITARQDGNIVIWSEKNGVSEELMTGSLGSVRSDQGPSSQSITISGNASRAATVAATYSVSSVEYSYTTLSSEYRLRIPPRAAIRPGDFILYKGEYYLVGEVSWSVSASSGEIQSQMEVSAT